MRQLYARRSPLALHESGDGRKSRLLLAIPYADLCGGNSAVLRDSGRFHKNQTRATDRTTAQMDRLPHIVHAVLGGILAHQRDANAILEPQPATFVGSKQ